MTFRASTQIQSDGLAEAKRLANSLVSAAVDHRDAMASATVSANLVLQVQREFQVAILRWDAIKAIPGMSQYAKDQENDQTYNVGTEVNTMIAAAEVVRDRVEADIPKNGAGFWLLNKFVPDHTISVKTFTTANTAPLRTDLDSFIATVS